MYMGVLHVYMSGHHMHEVPAKARGESPRTRVIDSCKHLGIRPPEREISALVQSTPDHKTVLSSGYLYLLLASLKTCKASGFIFLLPVASGPSDSHFTRFRLAPKSTSRLTKAASQPWRRTASITHPGEPL